MLEVTARIQIPLEEFSFSYVRSSGPGGQNVNKVNSKAVLRWNVAASPSLQDDVRARLLAKLGSQLTTGGELVLSSDRYRDQPRNREDCLAKVKAIVKSAATPPKKRRPTKPSRAAKARRRKSKEAQSQKKQQRRYNPD
jgi:ribosome-associated protein